MKATIMAVQKSVTSIPSSRLTIAQIRAALMTKPASPSVSTATGNAKRISSGHSTALATEIAIAAAIARSGSSMLRPGKIAAARYSVPVEIAMLISARI